MSQLRAENLQVIAGGTSIHPGADTLVADELDRSDGLVNRALLAWGDTQLAVQDQHDASSSSRRHLASPVPERQSGRGQWLSPPQSVSGEAKAHRPVPVEQRSLREVHCQTFVLSGPFLPWMNPRGFLASIL